MSQGCVCYFSQAPVLPRQQSDITGTHSLAHDIAVAAAVLPLCYDKESSPRRERRKSHELMSEPVQLNVILWLQIRAGDPGSPLLFLQVCMLQVGKYQSNTTHSSLEAITCHLMFSIINMHA